MNRKHFFTGLILSVLLGLTFTGQLQAQFTVYPKTPKVDFRYSASPVTKSLYVRSNQASPETCFDPRPKPILKKAMLYAIANWRGDYDNSNTQYTVALIVEAYSSFSGSSGLLATYHHSLVINVNTPQSYVAIDFTGLYATADRFVVKAEHLESGTSNPTIQNLLQTDVYYTEEFDYDVTNNLAGGPLLQNSTVVFSGSDATFKWAAFCEVPAPNHQFQLLRLYNKDASKTTNESDITANLDWSKALTIETGNSLQELTLTMAEGTGYYIWRVRPIGNAYEGGIANNNNWGLWSATGAYTQGNDYALTNNFLSTTSINNHVFYYVQPATEAQRNWAFSRTFIEGDAIKNKQVNIGEGISYANGLQMIQQTQVKLSSEDKVLAHQVIYDYSGRAALSTLPAPVNTSTLGYIAGYIRNASSNAYSAADFDEDINYNNPSRMDTVPDGPGRYYSNLNGLEEEVPTAAGYPFSRTLYMRDGTSKPREQSGPGTMFKLGNAGSNRHTNRHYTSGVAPIELITVFGDEAPDAASVLKSITTNANNQSSISYISKEGKTIATCLSGPPPSNLDALPSLPATGLTIDYYINNNSTYGDKGLIASKSIVLTEPTNILLSYSLTPNAYGDNCHAFCATCDYKVGIKIIDNDDPSAAPVYVFTKTVNPTSSISGCAGSAVTGLPNQLSIPLQPGSYTIERIIETYQVNTSGNATTTPVVTLPNTSYIDQYLIRIENAIRNNFSTGTATIVDDTGTPTGGPPVSMATLWSYIHVPYGQQPNMDGLYALLNVSTQDHVNLKINCDVITIPINPCPTETCPANNNFEQYLMDWCSAKGLSYATVAAKIIPGYGAGEFNTVIANMIDPACGNYNCQSLFSCWKSVISSYESLEQLAGTSLASSVNGMSMPPGNYTPDYLDLFLKCAGYKIKGISPVLGGAGCTNPGYKFHPYAYFRYSNTCSTCEQLFYAAINGNLATYPPVTVPPFNFVTYFNSFTAVPYTVTVSNTSGTVTLNPKEDFMACMKNCNAAGTGTIPLVTFDANTEAACKTTCMERYPEFVNQIIQAYHNAGQYVEYDAYTLVWNATANHYVFSTTPYVYTSGTYVTLETIYCQARGLVNACQASCTLTTITANGQTTLGTAAEHQAMATAMYGSYQVALPEDGGNCPEGFSKAPATAIGPEAVVAALNHQLDVQRSGANANGTYWNFKNFIDGDLDATITGKSECGTNTTVFVHPDIPSYFDFELINPTTYKLVYYFNKQSAGLSGIAPKALYSTSLLSAINGFSYTSAPVQTGSAAETAQLLSGMQSYVIGFSFSVLANSGTFTQLNTSNNGGLYTGVTNLYGYTLASPAGPAYYKMELCNNVRVTATITCADLCYKITPAAVLTTTSALFMQEGILFQPLSCSQQSASEILNTIHNQLSQIISNAKAKLSNLYQQTCIGQLSDEVKISYGVKYHHYTLFYYDRAGNLVKTVPPKGVVSGYNSRLVHPAHTMVTEYAYNSLKGLIRQKTPDGGESFFWCDNKGRLRFSRNAKQLAVTKMSYTKYDELGRPFEAGEMPASANPATDANNAGYPVSGVTQVVKTFYSVAANNALYFAGKAQRFLQNRVSYVYSDKDGLDATLHDRVSTYYSYDPHGHVEWLIQELPGLGKNYIAYEYDLMSGSVLQVKYNEAFADKFFHRYSYDIDKRIKTVETSKDGIYWEREADYSYYLHGPLKRTEIGHDQIQGTDYVYTINGWLKGMNHIEPAYDLGKDGNETGRAYLPKDVYAMHLGYFQGDYTNKASGYNSSSLNPYHLSASAGRDLYNGNISSWSSRYDLDAMNAANATMPFEDKTIASGRRFEYDELNRLKKATYITRNAGWNASSSYLETFGYDANGNLQNTTRNGYGNSDALRNMDMMTYNYYSPSNNNRLQKVTDVGDNAAPLRYNDIKTQTVTNNYAYDAVGSLTLDVQEGIDSIQWTTTGKVSRIVKDNQVMEFLYDAMGHRALKKIVDPTAPDQQTAAITTYYVLDASGNPMATYKRTNTGTSPNYVAKFDLQDQPIYGSKRLGMRSLNNVISRQVNYSGSNNPAGQNLPAAQHISAWPKLLIPLSNTTGKQVYTRKLDANSSSNTASDVGTTNELLVTEPAGSGITLSHDRNQAALMDEFGNVILSAYTYLQSNTGSTGYHRLYSHSSARLTNDDLINVNPSAQSLFAKRPGSENGYYYITIGADGKPYYHVIDLTANVVTQYNLLIDNTTGYGQSMMVIDDRVGGPSTLYLRRYASGTTTIKIFNITADGITDAGVSNITFSSDATTGAEGELQVSSNGSRLAIANTASSTGEIRVYDLSANHQTFTYKGRISMGTGTSARYTEFTAGDLRIYFTNRATATSTTGLYYVPVNLFVNNLTDLPLTSATLLNSVTSPVTGALRKGSNNNLYYTTNTTAAPNTLNIHMISNAEATPAFGAANAINSIITNGSLPLQPHVIDYQLPNATASVLNRVYKQKLYEITDHLGNVHATVYDYKLPLSNATVKWDKRFDNTTTEGFGVLAGSPANTQVTNADNRLKIAGDANSLGSGASVSISVTSLPATAGNRYILSFDVVPGTTSLASYNLSTTGSNLNLSGKMTVAGRYSIPFSLPTGGTTAFNIAFKCEESGADKTFSIDNVLIKTATSLSDAAVILNESAVTPTWNATNGTLTTGIGNMTLANTNAVTSASVSKSLAFIPGLVYKVSFNLNATTVGTGAPKISLVYDDASDLNVDYKALITSATGSSAYEFYIIPQATSGLLSFTYENTTAQAFAFTVSNLNVTQYQNQGQALYAAAINSLQDYYAFGMLMPGKGYTNAGYRYGFQSQEKDDELKGNGNSLNYEYRMHDARLGRFFAVDPLSSKYPHNSPYAFSENRLIASRELEGLESSNVILGAVVGVGITLAKHNSFSITGNVLLALNTNVVSGELGAKGKINLYKNQSVNGFYSFSGLIGHGNNSNMGGLTSLTNSSGSNFVSSDFNPSLGEGNIGEKIKGNNFMGVGVDYMHTIGKRSYSDWIITARMGILGVKVKNETASPVENENNFKNEKSTNESSLAFSYSTKSSTFGFEYSLLSAQSTITYDGGTMLNPNTYYSTDFKSTFQLGGTFSFDSGVNSLNTSYSIGGASNPLSTLKFGGIQNVIFNYNFSGQSKGLSGGTNAGISLNKDGGQIQ